MDPVQKLPPEITAEIFSYLDSQTLLTASLASRAWRERIQDSLLWRKLYLREGWQLNVEEVIEFERQRAEALQSASRKARMRRSESEFAQPLQKKRVTPGRVNSGASSVLDQNEETSIFGFNASTKIDSDSQMRDVADADYFSRKDDIDQNPPWSPYRERFMSPAVRADNPAKLNWTYLYRQRRKLEDNWLNGRFKNFQLPHPLYPWEAHRECIYTIQFSGNWLVSGSRDKTIRIWDLETKRLRCSPLLGHSRSVLCLQFDASEDEDIIISGSSDRNVIVWRFSTGEKLHELTNAHLDSVLSLRFDKRYLVTCSKDKLIKVWNRRELRATDENYPRVFAGVGVRYPSYIVDTSIIPPSTLEAQIANEQIQTLAPYSLLMTLDGHGAAVNAIQIDNNEIVSASGDRLIKIWDIRSGTCLKTLVGHQKGIACVQFDNKRIVSGSNDYTVRIYDHESGAEVACLQGHDDLVRTLQAGFGDPPGSEETLRLEAMEVEREYWEARRRGEIPEIEPGRRRASRLRNPGSRRPQDIVALGAKIPPGGGGSHWARIVSGSYDETIIIWKRDREGKWVVGQRLRQTDAARAASTIDETLAAEFLARTLRNRSPAVIRQLQPAPHSPGNPAPTGSLSNPVLTPVPSTVGVGHITQASHNLTISQPSIPSQNAFTIQQGQVTREPQPPPGRVIRLPPITSLAPNPSTQTQENIHGPNPQQQPIPEPVQLPPLNLPTQPTGRPPAPVPHVAATTRIFKLQFDARKLICASQDHIIVGWDFANGDKRLEEACRFFAGL